MRDKYYDILFCEYEKLNADRPDVYKMSFDEVIMRLKKLFSKADFSDAPSEKKIATAINWLHDGDALMKYYNAFKTHDMEMLNGILYETAHLLQMCNISSIGTDHSYYGLRITPNLLAANMMDRVKLLLPEDNGVSTSSYIGVAIANLLMGIIYDSPKLKEDSLKLCEKQLDKKIAKYYRLYIECMIAVLKCDYDEFNNKINLFCKAYTGAREYDMNGFNRRFCIEAHGMYNLAKYAYNGAMKEKIALPAADNFCQDLAVWQEEHDCRHGKIYYNYPEELDFYNRLMKCQPVTMHLIKNGRSRCIDTGRYLKELIENNELVL